MAVLQPQASPLWPPEDEHPRRRPALTRVYAPDGHSELHTRENAAELVRRHTPAWSFKPPRPPEDDLLEEPAADAGPYPVIPADDRPLTVTTLDKLTRARTEAREAGIAVDPTWGIRRLNEEVVKRRRTPAAQASPAEDAIQIDDE